MGQIRLEKRCIRGLAVAESFGPGSNKSVLTGVVMRGDLVMDGVVFGRATLKGDDVTDSILSMFERLGRDDICYLLVSGMVMSMYNIVDMSRLHSQLGIPVIGVSYRESGGLEQGLRERFPSSHAKLAAYDRLGQREQITLHTSGRVFVRTRGCSTGQAAVLLNRLTLQGSVPEPLRISKMLSKALLGRLAF